MRRSGEGRGRGGGERHWNVRGGTMDSCLSATLVEGHRSSDASQKKRGDDRRVTPRPREPVRASLGQHASALMSGASVSLLPPPPPPFPLSPPPSSTSIHHSFSCLLVIASALVAHRLRNPWCPELEHVDFPRARTRKNMRLRRAQLRIKYLKRVPAH